MIGCTLIVLFELKFCFAANAIEMVILTMMMTETVMMTMKRRKRRKMLLMIFCYQQF